MIGVPSWLQGKEVVITKTPNGGFAVSEHKDDPVELCAVFETWDAAIYYLLTHYVPDP